MSSERTTVYNQNEVLQDCKQVALNCEGAIEQITNDINAGKAPSRFMSGGDDFNPLAETLMASKGSGASIAATVYSETASGPSQAEDKFFSWTNYSAGTGMTKADKARQSRYCDYNMLTGEASYSKKKENAAMREKERQGRAPKSKDPFLSGGASHVDVFGNSKQQAKKPRWVNKEEVRNTLGKKFEENRQMALYEEDNRSDFAVTKGASEEKKDMMSMLQMRSVDAVLKAAESLPTEAQDKIVKQVVREEELVAAKKDDDVMTAQPLLSLAKKPSLPKPSWMEMPKPPSLGGHGEKRDN